MNPPNRASLRRLIALGACLVLWSGFSSSAESLPTAMQHYQLLEAARTRYAVLAAQSALTVLPQLPRRSVRPGETYSGAAALRTLLVAVGDLPTNAADGSSLPEVLDPALVQALIRFQERHGLAPDGVLGPTTWRALTTPLSARLRQIELTLARWRSLPPNPYRRAIFINIPRFRLYAMEGADDRESGMLQMDVVVGRVIEDLQTPTFTADLTHLIFSPYWDVPRSITLAELVPAARRDPDYFAAHHYDLLDGTGEVVPYSAARLGDLAAGTLRLRQRPGADNALGAVKFMLPNPDGVYLHDTPERALFAHTTRTFSHGCIRVAEPAVLATWLLREDEAWNAARIDAAMHGAEPLRVDLGEPVRVYVVYGTAIAREDGSVLFLNDPYGLDAGQ